jgi:hypothetical protein
MIIQRVKYWRVVHFLHYIYTHTHIPYYISSDEKESAAGKTGEDIM